ncbi:MAG: Holliday junction DNA helicase RuvA [Nitrospinae bacterium RIFCSPLOWO2_12_FULL_47_7]|nr:MAG: Holliday junction DNA helicase RuvA [Nitrospinae bacterium RIFCSPLOWO2_12_FULL_47_7]
MIAYLKGKLIYKSPVHVIIDVSGVGYQVFIPLSTYYALPELHGDISLKIYTHMTEDALKLFGFLSSEEQKSFETLISINKVGPKLALTILSGISAQDLITAITNNDLARLSSIHGVGRKTAERLVLEMKDKLPAIIEGVSTNSTPAHGVMDDALSALINLGYKKSEAEKALKNVRGQTEGDLPIEHLIKESLKFLS